MDEQTWSNASHSLRESQKVPEILLKGNKKLPPKGLKHSSRSPSCTPIAIVFLLPTLYPQTFIFRTVSPMLTRDALANHSHGSGKLPLKQEQDLKRSHKAPTGVQEFSVFQSSWYVLPDEVS